MKKTLTFILALLLLAVFLVACSDKAGIKTDDPVNVEKNPVVTDKGMTFFHTPRAGAAKVFLMGAFNGWAPDDEDFQLKAGADGRWSVTVRLEKGRYEYKFVVDGRQFPDTISKETESDGAGGIKSLVTVP